jgi:hypothetical protein
MSPDCHVPRLPGLPVTYFGLCLSALGEDLRELVAGDAFAAIDLGHALFEPLVGGGLADFEPFLLGLEEVECLGDEGNRHGKI